MRKFIQIPIYTLILPIFPTTQIFSLTAHRITITHYFIFTLSVFAIYISLRSILFLLPINKEKIDPLIALTFVSLLMYDFIFPSEGYLLIWLIGFSVIYYYVIWGNWNSTRFTHALSLFAIVIIVPPIYTILFDSPLFGRSDVRKVANNAFVELPALPATPDTRRDIYFLVFDRYARGDQLSEIYGFDNEPFLDELAARGFYVDEDAYANYQRTAHSLASTLNMDYLTNMDNPVTEGTRDWVPLYELIQNFRLHRFLKSAGYRFEFLGTWWEPTRINKYADRNYNLRALPLLLTAWLDRSLLGNFSKWIELRYLDPRFIQCKREKYKFRELATVGEDDNPQFVFAHFLVPHPPFVFDANGDCMSATKASSRSRTENYIGQIRYTNREILRLIDKLFAKPGPRPIIVLQADEGPWPERYAGDEINRLGADTSSVKWSQTTPSELREKMAILSAVYLPNGAFETETYGETSPVNTFRTILRKYFSVDLSPLPNRYFAFESSHNIYSFIDVTKKLSQSPAGTTPARDPAPAN